MNIKVKINNLELTALTETEIVTALGITHLVYRRHCYRVPAEVLSSSCKTEIKHCTLQDEHTLIEIARLYRTTYSQVHIALYQKFSHRPAPTDDRVLAHLIEHDSLELTRAHFGITKKDFPQYLRSVGWLDTTDTGKRAALIARDIIASPEVPYRSLAHKHGVSEGYVAKVAHDNHISRQKQGRTDWPDILVYAHTHGIASAARHYNVSRPSIYYHINKG